ncbi:MAG: hypothetical protein AVDCRST_MAG24-1732, partial [uncultured Nocardioidaceae bacterium]
AVLPDHPGHPRRRVPLGRPCRPPRAAAPARRARLLPDAGRARGARRHPGPPHQRRARAARAGDRPTVRGL